MAKPNNKEKKVNRDKQEHVLLAVTFLAFLATLFWAIDAKGEEVLKETLFFAPASAELTPKARLQLKDVSAAVLEHEYRLVVAVGHASTPGSQEFNFLLAKKRAEAVKRELARLGASGAVKLAFSQGELGDAARKVDVYLVSAKTHKNMLILHLGGGREGLDVGSDAGGTRVREGVGFEAGATYMRKVGKNLHLGISGFTNPTVTGNIGISW